MRCCPACGRTFKEGTGCKERPVTYNGRVYPPIPYGKEPFWQYMDYDERPEEFCKDCGVPLGEYHHELCTQEECPVCGTLQRLTCKCTRDIRISRRL